MDEFVDRRFLDLIHNKACSICSCDDIRIPVNEMLLKYLRGDVVNGEKMTMPYILDAIQSIYHKKPPTLPSLSRHYLNHIKYYIEHPDDIPDKVWKEYNVRHAKAAVDKPSETRNRTKTDEEMEMLMQSIRDGEAKIHEVFPVKDYNSELGTNGPKLSWEDWCYKYLRIKDDNTGKMIPMKLEPYQIDILKLIDQSQGILLLIARGHRKSTILQIYAMRKLCDWKAKIIYLSGSAEEVTRYTENIRTELKENPAILHDYGYLPHPEHGDSKKGMMLRESNEGGGKREFDKDPHLTWATLPKANGGSSKLGAHPAYIIGDDMQGEDVEMFETLKRKHEKWFDRNIMPMRKGKTKMIFAGTRKAADDIYNYIKEKHMIVTIEFPAIKEFPNDGQQEPVHDNSSQWDYVYEKITSKVGEEVIESEILNGVKNLRNGKVFWDGFRSDYWDQRAIKYHHKDGTIDRTRMALQELLIEKGLLEAKAEQGGFSFSSEYQLRPVETKGRHFNKDAIRFFSHDKWLKICKSDHIPKYTWIDVGYSDSKDKKHKDVKKGKTVLATMCRIDRDTRGFAPEEAGVYLLDVRSGNYMLQSDDPKKSLVGALLEVYELFKPEMMCFEENFFGNYIKVNLQMFNEYNLPIDGKRNQLDKHVRISNGISALLAIPEGVGGFFMCKESNGFQEAYKQISEFPFCAKLDEIDAIESCHRLLIKNRDKVVIVGDLLGDSHPEENLCKTCESFDKSNRKCNLVGTNVDSIKMCPKMIKRRSNNNMMSNPNAGIGVLRDPLPYLQHRYRGMM